MAAPAKRSCRRLPAGLRGPGVRPGGATGHGGARETILPEVTGWLAAPGDPAALAAAIGQALALDGAQRAAFAHRAPTHVPACFTREAMCSRTIDVYEELLFPEPAAAAVPERQAMAVVA